MHANIEQLLEIKDGLRNEVSSHVDTCGRCQYEMEVLKRLEYQVFETADQTPPREIWNRILMAARRSGKGNFSDDTLPESIPLDLLVAKASPPSRFNSLSTAIYSLAASVVLTGMIGLFIYGQNSSLQQSAMLQANVQQLMLDSRGMEQVLQKVAMQNKYLSNDQQSAADRLYWKISYVDQLIHENADDYEKDPERMKALWNDRIDALTELSQIYYQRQLTLDESEI